MEVKSALSERIHHTTGIDLDGLTEQIREAAITLNHLKAQMETAEALRTVVRSMEAERIRKEKTEAGEKVTESRLSDLAQSSPEYRSHLADQDTIRIQVVEAEAEYYALRNLRENHIEMLRFARTELMNG